MINTFMYNLRHFYCWCYHQSLIVAMKQQYLFSTTFVIFSNTVRSVGESGALNFTNFYYFWSKSVYN